MKCLASFSEAKQDPRSGSLVAIDCEFVCLAAALTEKGDDGSEKMIRPARLSLARVSVLRGDRHFLQSEPFIDDYIRYGHGCRFHWLLSGRLR